MKFHYEDLRVVDDIRIFIRDIYDVTKKFPSEERFGLTSQIRRAATSVLLTLAEGSARRSKKEYARFIKMSLGSLVEVDAGMKIAVSLNFCTHQDWEDRDPQLKQIYFTLIALRKTIESQDSP